MRILFITDEHLGPKRAGPAIRCLELARVLSSHHQVTIATLDSGEVQHQELPIINNAGKSNRLRQLAAASDIIVTQGMILALFPRLTKLGKYLVVDLYDPFLLEYITNPHPRFPQLGCQRQVDALTRQLESADFFLCANERQQDYWLGWLSSCGRITPDTYREDPSLARLISVVPFGLSAVGPKHTTQVAKGKIPNIQPDDLLMLWAGGIWEWLDPLTPIRAVALLVREHPEVKLLFLGTQSPGSKNRSMPVLAAAIELARSLDLLDRHVFFREGWVDYEQRQNFLLEADVGVSAHPHTIEARFAFRTRVLDYLWAGLPMVLTDGDWFAEQIRSNALGRTVRVADEGDWRDAVVSLATVEARMDLRRRTLLFAEQFHWDRVAAPLLAYCAAPYFTGKPSFMKNTAGQLLSNLLNRYRARQLQSWSDG